MPNDELTKYYDYLKANNADVPTTIESFERTLLDPVASKQYYNYLRENKFDTPDSYETFVNTFDLKKKGSSVSSDTKLPYQKPVDVSQATPYGMPKETQIPFVSQGEKPDKTVAPTKGEQIEPLSKVAIDKEGIPQGLGYTYSKTEPEQLGLTEEKKKKANDRVTIQSARQTFDQVLNTKADGETYKVYDKTLGIEIEQEAPNANKIAEATEKAERLLIKNNLGSEAGQIINEIQSEVISNEVQKAYQDPKQFINLVPSQEEEQKRELRIKGYSEEAVELAWENTKDIYKQKQAEIDREELQKPENYGGQPQFRRYLLNQFGFRNPEYIKQAFNNARFNELQKKDIHTPEETKEYSELFNKIQSSGTPEMFNIVTGERETPEYKQAVDTEINYLKQKATTKELLSDEWELRGAAYVTAQKELNAFMQKQQRLAGQPIIGDYSLVNEQINKLQQNVKDAGIAFDAASRLYVLNESPSNIVVSKTKTLLQGITKSLLGSMIAPQAEEAFLRGLNPTERQILSLQEKIMSQRGIKPTDEEKEKFEVSFGEGIAAMTGDLIGIMPKIMLYSYLFGMADVPQLINGGKIIYKGRQVILGGIKNPLLRLAANIVTEESKMQMSGFNTGAGGGFAIAGEVLPKTMVKLPGRLKLFQPLVNKMIPATLGGTLGMETAMPLEISADVAISNLFGDKKSFDYHFKQAYPSLEGVAERIGQELIVNAMLGGYHGITGTKGELEKSGMDIRDFFKPASKFYKASVEYAQASQEMRAEGKTKQADNLAELADFARYKGDFLRKSAVAKIETIDRQIRWFAQGPRETQITTKEFTPFISEKAIRILERAKTEVVSKEELLDAVQEYYNGIERINYLIGKATKSDVANGKVTDFKDLKVEIWKEVRDIKQAQELLNTEKKVVVEVGEKPLPEIGKETAEVKVEQSEPLSPKYEIEGKEYSKEEFISEINRRKEAGEDIKDINVENDVEVTKQVEGIFKGINEEKTQSTPEVKPAKEAKQPETKPEEKPQLPTKKTSNAKRQGKKITPNKKVKTELPDIINEVSQVPDRTSGKTREGGYNKTKWGDLYGETGEYLFDKFKDKKAGTDVSKEDMLDFDKNMYDEKGELTKDGKVIKELENAGYIEGNIDNEYTLTELGKNFIDAVKTRVETRKGLKEGIDLFPEEAGIKTQTDVSKDKTGVAGKIVKEKEPVAIEPIKETDKITPETSIDVQTPKKEVTPEPKIKAKVSERLSKTKSKEELKELLDKGEVEAGKEYTKRFNELRVEEAKTEMAESVRELMKSFGIVKEIYSTPENKQKVWDAAKKAVMAAGKLTYAELKQRFDLFIENINSYLPKKLTEKDINEIHDYIFNPEAKEVEKQSNETEKNVAASNKLSNEWLKSADVEPLYKEARKSNPELWKETLNEIETGKIDIDKEIINIGGGRSVLDPIKQQAIILAHAVKTEMAIRQARRLMAETEVLDMSNVAKIKALADIAHLESEMQANNLAVRKTGETWGRWGQMRQYLARMDYSLAAMVAKAKTFTLGKELKQKHIDKFNELAKNIEDLSEKLSETENRLKEERQANKTKEYEEKLRIQKEFISTLEREVEKAITPKKAGDPIRKFADKVLEGKIEFDFNQFNSAVPFATEAYNLAIKTIAVTLKGTAKIADAVEAGLKILRETDWYKGLKEKDKFENAFRKKYTDEYSKEISSSKGKEKSSLIEKIEEKADGEIHEGLEGLLRKLAKEKVKAGMNKFEDVLDAVVKDLEEFIPNVDKETVADVMSGYGKYSKLSKVEIDAQMRKLTRTGRLRSALRDVKQRGILPKRSGVEREPLTDDQRRIQTEIKRVLKELDIKPQLTTEQVEAKWRSDLEAYQKRLENSISDIQNEIDTRTRRAKTKGKVYDDPITNELKQRLKDKKAERDALLGKPDRSLTVEQRQDIVIKNLNNTIENIEKGIQAIQVGKTDPNVIFPEKSKKRVKVSNETIDKLREKKAKLIAERDALLPEAVKEQAEFDAYMRARERRLEYLKTKAEQLKKGEYTPRKVKEIPQLAKTSAEVKKINLEIFKAKEESDKLVEKIRLENREAIEKIWDGFVSVWNLPKALIASVDFSAAGRQGIFFVTKPKTFSKAFVSMFKYAFSEKQFTKYMDEIRSDPEFDVMINRHKLDLTLPSAKLSAREELYFSKLLDSIKKVPIYGWAIAGSERAYVGFLNKLRVDLYYNFKSKLEKIPMTQEQYDAEMKSYSYLINIGTGRSKLGKFEKAASILNGIYFAPRLAVSRFEIAGMLLNPKTWSSKTPEYRKEALKQWFGYFGTISLTLILFKNAFGDDVDVELDARSSDFGRIKYKNFRYDLLAGIQQPIRLVRQIQSKQRKDVMTGEITNYKKTFPFTTPTDIASQYVTNKISPSMGLLLTLINDENPFTREEFNTVNDFMRLVVPITLQDIKEISQEEGAGEAILPGIIATFGIGMNYYNPNPIKTYSKDYIKEVMDKRKAPKKELTKEEKRQNKIEKALDEERLKSQAESYGIKYVPLKGKKKKGLPQ